MWKCIRWQLSNDMNGLNEGKVGVGSSCKGGQNDMDGWGGSRIGIGIDDSNREGRVWIYLVGEKWWYLWHM